MNHESASAQETAWRERIILEPRTFGASLPLPRDADGGDDVAFDIAAH